MFLQDIYVYPLKSAAGIRLEKTDLDKFGLAFDRRWMLVDGEGQFLSQRVLPRMALLRVLEYEQRLVVEAPGMKPIAVPVPDDTAARVPVVVWDDECEAVLADNKASERLSEFLGADCRLVYAPNSFERPVDPTRAPPDARVGFADGFPLLVIGQASLDDLNARLNEKGEAAVPMNRFRPNLVIAGSAPFEEDDWHQLMIGEPGTSEAVTLDIVKPCARCSIVPVDQATGIRGKEPLATLATYRRREGGEVYFGQNALHRGNGPLRVGASVRVP